MRECSASLEDNGDMPAPSKYTESIKTTTRERSASLKANGAPIVFNFRPHSFLIIEKA
ncbi:hypothetical protein BCR33DRAFT_793280 [Rhizoclosmatium globosum]|uniref:Uncharacterized protein n=1 Tax=Rhizoclosmatium globosum TaxID=329046 RepID=A0A1Y2B1N9_9FUNG|nr:hypothetical protein BCR33DRAFT_793280 [Rhizoclosmatium globosum]|eukprot:ORY28654.1 hypothetical protein BCR33DRAFT_793280 [Rhizoclosmatium globosum]